MSHDLSSPALSSAQTPDRCGGAPVRPAFRSPGLAAMTRRYIDGKIDLRQLLAFDGTTLATPASRRRPY